MNTKTKTIWPDMSIDQLAWNLAKVALGQDAPTSDLAARAQDIKLALAADLKNRVAEPESEEMRRTR